MKITAKQYAHAWYAALEAAPKDQWDDISQRFLQHIHSYGFMKQLPHIQYLIERLEYQKKGVTPVLVRSAHTINADILQAVISQVIGDIPVDIRLIEDPLVIGGVKIETENSRWDMSLHGELRQLKKTLT